MSFLEKFHKLMDESKILKPGLDPQRKRTAGAQNLFNLSVSRFIFGINQSIQNHLKLNELEKGNEGIRSKSFSSETDKRSIGSLDIDLEKQLQAWRDNPSWSDEPPVVNVSTQKGSLCHLNLEVNVGLPPDAIFDIFTDPENKKYFRSVKENISRKVLSENGSRQLVEVEQAAAWKFLWWSGTFPLHLIVDQNREDYSSSYKQGETRFMKTFEGCWRVEPLFVDEHLCNQSKPKTLEDYCECTGGKGRIGSKVKMEQLFQPSAILTPPPISWYVRGITVRTTETMVEDLVAEAARIRGGETGSRNDENGKLLEDVLMADENLKLGGIKERWELRKREKRLGRKISH